MIHHNLRWWLNNFLLTEKKYKDQIEGIIREFFDFNSILADDSIVWDAFNAYIPGTLIAINSHETCERDRICSHMLQEITSLEAILKTSLQALDYIKLQEEYGQLNMLDVQKIRQQLLYGRQKVFEYREKLGKGLAYVSAERPKIDIKDADRDRGLGNIPRSEIRHFCGLLHQTL